MCSSDLRIRAYEDGLLSLLRGKNAALLTSIATSKDLSDADGAALKALVEAYTKSFS